MFGIRELDKKNIYNPNLKDINESAERTYEEANIFFDMVEGYLKKIENKVNNLSHKQLYDISNAIASELAKCSELYLKALYIYENNIYGNNIDDIWKELKSSTYKTDKNGNLIYLLEKNNGENVLTFVKTDIDGKKIKDENNKCIYIDCNKNEYSEGQQGKKIKQNGHQLDRLIELLSNDSRMLLEIRMLMIPMSNTEIYDKISIYDELKKNDVIFGYYQMTPNVFFDWINQHKRTYEETRYAGQKQHNINLEFLYHLTKQLKVVAQYKLSPQNNQLFNISKDETDLNDLNILFDLLKSLEKDMYITFKVDDKLDYYDDFNEFYNDFNKLDENFKYLFYSINYNQCPKNLLKSLLNDFNFKYKISQLNKIYEDCSHITPLNISLVNLYNMLNLCDNEEINYLATFSLAKVYEYHNLRVFKSHAFQSKEHMVWLNSMFSKNEMVSYAIYLKKKYNCKINNDIFLNFVDFINMIKLCYDKIDKELVKNIDKVKDI